MERYDADGCWNSFGAVLEEFEVSDAIATVLAEKDGTAMALDMPTQPQALPAQ